MQLLSEWDLPLINIGNEFHYFYFLRLYKATQRSENMVNNRGVSANLKSFDVTNLLNSTVILLNHPMLIM